MNIEQMTLTTAQNAAKCMELHYTVNNEEANSDDQFAIPRMYMIFEDGLDEIGQVTTKEYHNDDIGMHLYNTYPYTLNVLESSVTDDESPNTVNTSEYIQNAGEIIDLTTKEIGNSPASS